jgi:hypothetical protein
MPDWRTPLASRLAPLALPPAREREIIDELAQHLDDRYQELLTAGTSPEQAVQLALDEIDDDELLAREMQPLMRAIPPERIPHGVPPRHWLADARQDLVYAARTLRKSPGFAAAAILTLALGIGANTAIFSLVNATLFRHLPVQNRDRASYVFAGRDWNILSYPAYATLRDGARLLDGLAAWGYIGASLNVDGETDIVQGAIVTGNFFDVLGLSTGVGRVISTSDDVTPMEHPVAVISHRLWQTRFGGRADIIGREIRLNGRPFTIIGVVPAAFTGPQIGLTRDIYVPMMMQALIRPPRAGYSGEMNPDLLKNANNGWLFQVVLRKPGVTDEQAAEELSALATSYAHTRNPNAPPQRVTLLPIDAGNPTERARLRSAALLLGGVVGAILLIACANVANLLLSRATARRREVGIRIALGASRWRIMRQLLTESVLLAMVGGAAGLLVAWLIIKGVEASPPPGLPIALDFALDGRVLLFSFALSLVTGLVFGAAPAVQTSRQDLVSALKQEALVPDARARRINLKNSLVVVEVALSLMLLIVAGLFVRSLGTVQAIDPGYAVDEVASTSLNINLLRYTRVQGREFYSRVVERMEAIPGVRSASVARVAVLTGGGRTTAVVIEGRSDSGNRDQSEGSGLGTWHDARADGDGKRDRAGVFCDARHSARQRPRLRQHRYRDVAARRDRQRIDGEAVLSRRGSNRQATLDRLLARRKPAGRLGRDRGCRAQQQVRVAQRAGQAGDLHAARAAPRNGRHALRPRERRAELGGRADTAGDPGARAEPARSPDGDDDRNHSDVALRAAHGRDAAHAFRRPGVVAGLAWNLRRSRVLRRAPHARDRHSRGARRGSPASHFSDSP